MDPNQVRWAVGCVSLLVSFNHFVYVVQAIDVSGGVIPKEIDDLCRIAIKLAIRRLSLQVLTRSEFRQRTEEWPIPVSNDWFTANTLDLMV